MNSNNNLCIPNLVIVAEGWVLASVTICIFPQYTEQASSGSDSITVGSNNRIGHKRSCQVKGSRTLGPEA